MAEPLIPIRIVGLMPGETGVAIFLGNEDKTFSIQVEKGVGDAIHMLLKGEKRERPMTHDLIDHIFRAFQITVEKIVIDDLRNDTYFARLTLKAENEVHRKITEIDARPSDCLAISLETQSQIFVSSRVWNKVMDLTPYLEKMKELQREKEKIDGEEEGESGQEDDPLK